MSSFPEEYKAYGKYIVKALIVGADETLLKINLTDGFRFKSFSLDSDKDSLEKTFDVTPMGVHREFKEAIIDSETQSIICAIKEANYTFPVGSYYEQLEQLIDADLRLLNNQIKAIRFAQECFLRFGKISFQFIVTKCKMGDVSVSFNLNKVIPYGEAMGAKLVSRFHCTEQEAKRINEQIANLSFPLSDSTLNSCHKYYDLSYHTDLFISISLLMTALEILFLKKDAGNKKEMLAKRCAVFLYDGNKQIKNTYTAIKELYKKRSEFVHEGIESAVTKEDIITVRSFVRDALLKALSRHENKSQRIDRVQQLVTQRQELFEE